MAEHDDALTPAEVFVLTEVDTEALLYEIPAAWTDNGSDIQRTQAVPVLREAVLSLARRGLVEVHHFPAWPINWQQAIPVTADNLVAALDGIEAWLWRGDDTSLITISLTNAGVTWLTRQTWP